MNYRGRMADWGVACPYWAEYGFLTQRLLTIVGQGGSGYLFEKAVEKVCVIDSSIDFLATAETASAARPHAISLQAPTVSSGR